MAFSGNKPYPLDENRERGIKEAVSNNQLNLAMFYLLEILDEMTERIEELESNKPAVAKKTTAKKATKKATAEKKEEATEE